MTTREAIEELRNMRNILIDKYINSEESVDAINYAIYKLMIIEEQERVTDLDTAIEELDDYGLFNEETPQRIRNALEYMISTIRGMQK